MSWVVVDDAYELRVEACVFLAGRRGPDRSINTERVYAGRVASFLSWCATEGIDWREARLDQMVRFKRWLTTTPLPPRSSGSSGKLRSPATGDAILGTVCEFLRFCAHHDLVDRTGRWWPCCTSAAFCGFCHLATSRARTTSSARSGPGC